MNLTRLLCLVLVINSLFTLQSLAQKKGGGAGGGASNTNSTSSPASASTAQASTAPIEEQVLAFSSLDMIAKNVAIDVCSKPEFQSDPSKQTVVIFDQATFANIAASEGFFANAKVMKSAYQNLANEYPPTPNPAEQGGQATTQHTFIGDMLDARRMRLTQMQGIAKNQELSDALRKAAQEQVSNLNNSVVSLTISPLDPFSDFTSFIGAIATASNTETAGTIVIPDSAVAVALTRELKNSQNGCASSPQVIYPPLFGGGSATDTSSADIQSEIQEVDDARDIAVRYVTDAMKKSQMGNQRDNLPAGNPIINTVLTDVNGLYDNFMNSLLQVNSSTGVIGSASIIQGDQLVKLLTGYPDKDGKPTKKPAYILLASVLSAGGTEHDHKNFWRSLGPGDQISYSAGIVVNYALWKTPAISPSTASTGGSSNTPISSNVLRYRLGYTKFKSPPSFGNDCGDSMGNNLTLSSTIKTPKSECK